MAEKVPTAEPKTKKKKKEKKETSCTITSVIKQLRIFKNLENDFVRMNIVFVWLTYCSGGPKMGDLRKWIMVRKSEKETSGCFKSVMNQLRTCPNMVDHPPLERGWGSESQKKETSGCYLTLVLLSHFL